MTTLKLKRPLVAWRRLGLIEVLRSRAQFNRNWKLNERVYAEWERLSVVKDRERRIVPVIYR